MKREQDNPTFNMDLVGYARVSTEEQNLDMQRHALLRAGVHPDAIFEEILSGASTRRPQRDLLLKRVRPGMTLVVWKLDRISRSLLDLLTFMKRLEELQVGFRSLQDSIDTNTPAGRVMLAMLGAFAQFERDLIAQRTRAGVMRAKERGVRFGQPTRFTPDKVEQAEALIAAGLSVKAVAKRMNFAMATIRSKIDGKRIQELVATAPKRKR